MTILGTGLTGLVGSRIVELLKNSYTFENMGRLEGVDITNASQVNKKIAETHADVVLHLAAYTDVKKAEQEKLLGEQSGAWQVNVIGTENIAKACKEFGKKLIYISTDLVFDGEDMPEGGYTENSKPHPLSWYAVTKWEGEKQVVSHLQDFTILRIAYPYRAEFDKLDFVRLFLQKLRNNEELTVLSDRVITPTFIDDIAYALRSVIDHDAQGIYHIVGSESLSILECAKEIAQVFSLDAGLIHRITREEFLVGRPPEPFNSSLNNDKIKQLGVKMRGFSEGLQEIKKQIKI